MGRLSARIGLSNGQPIPPSAATALFLGIVVPCARWMCRRYGSKAGRRFGAVAAALLLTQHKAVVEVIRAHGGQEPQRPSGLQPVDVLTLSRGLSTAILAGIAAAHVNDRRGPAGWLGWLVLIYGAIVCDWLDGPFARRVGPSEAGAIFDLEGDSWLTLWSAIAAVSWGGLPRYTAVPALARYGSFFALLRHLSYAGANDHPPLERQAGIAQMTLFLAALAPFGGGLTRPLLRPGAALIVPLQLGTMAMLFARKLAVTAAKAGGQQPDEGKDDAAR